jgi:hypothetical protein
VNAVEILQRSCPFPFIAEGKLYDGTIYKQLNICRKCELKSCQTAGTGELRHFTCVKGMSCYPVSAHGQRIVLNGLIVSEHNGEITGKRRKPYRENVISHQAIAEFHEHTQQLSSSISNVVSQEIKGNLAYLHDIRTSVGIVLSWCQDVVSGGQGATFEEKLKAAPDDLLGLYQSISLLKEQLALADIISNPAAITYGLKNRSSINGFMFKMFKIWEPRFRKKGLRLELDGYTRARIEAYNSIQFIPLILLDNALKYCSGSHITFINLSEIQQGSLVEVRVSSYGKVVPREFWSRIFEQYVRGPNGIEMNAEGMGLGLYIAQRIAEAHGFKVQYKSTTTDGVNGSNDFFFQMPICGHEE